MAKPDGAFEVGELAWTLNDSDGDPFYTEVAPAYCYVAFRCPMHPTWLCDKTAEEEAYTAHDLLPQRVGVAYEIYISTADDTVTTVGFASDKYHATWTTTSTGAIGPIWSANVEDDEYPKNMAVKFTPYPGDNPIMVGLVEIRYYGDSDNSDYGNTDIRALKVYNVLDNGESEKVEWISRNASKQYAPDYPASAWMICDVLIGGLRHSIADNKINFSLPIGGKYPLVE